MKGRVRHYLPFVGVPNLVLVLGTIVVCLAAILLAGGRLAALPASIAELWFVLHGVPVDYDGVVLGAIPMLPAIGVAAFIAWRVRVATRDRVSILDLYVIFGLVVLIPFTLSAIAWFMVADAAPVFPVSPPPIHKALFIPVFVHVVGMVCGMSGRLWKALLARIGAPDSLFDASRATVRLSLRLLGAAGIVYVVLLALGYGRLSGLLGEFPSLGFGGGLGLVIVCLLYLPNAVVSTLAVLLGAPFEIAQGGISLFESTLVPLPPFPLFAAIPGQVPVWAPALLLVPAGVMVHYVISRRLGGIEIVFAAALAAVFALFAGLMSGGEVGAYGWIGPNPWFFAAAAAAWVGIIAGIAWLVARLTQKKAEEKQPDEDEPEDIEEVVEETEPEEEPEPEETEPKEEPEPEETEPEEESDGEEDVDKPGGSTAISVLRNEQLN